MEKLGASETSLAFEVKGGRLIVKSESALPSVRYQGRAYVADEGPSVIVNGRKYAVDCVI